MNGYAHSLLSSSTLIISAQGAFDSFEHTTLPRTKYDTELDQASNKPGEQAFEKMISGKYLGELFRLVLCELIDEGILFLGQNTYKVGQSAYQRPRLELTARYR